MNIFIFTNEIRRIQKGEYYYSDGKTKQCQTLAGTKNVYPVMVSVTCKCSNYVFCPIHGGMN